MAEKLAKRPDFHWRSPPGSVRQRLRVVCGSLRVVAGSLPIGGGLLQIAFVLPQSSLFRLPAAAAAAFAHVEHAPSAVAPTLLVSARPRAHAFQPRAALPHGDVLPYTAAVALRNGILCVESGPRHTRCNRQCRE